MGAMGTSLTNPQREWAARAPETPQAYEEASEQTEESFVDSFLEYVSSY